jgi:D-alanyl-D-alanine carboxypeptidase/D-alanyl-D-alanine-endopeptidase (penicillin-binding protein 4)
MIDGISLAMFGFLAQLWGGNPQSLPLGAVVSWQQAKIFDIPTQEDPVVTSLIQDYLQELAAKGYDPNRQGIWMRTEWAYLAQQREDLPVSAASLTKVATSLAVMDKWGLDHRFETRFYTLGTLQNGVLTGDLVIEGGYDPLFVWEEAIAVGNALNQLGLQKITGNIIITGPFAMNFKTEPAIAGNLLKQALDSSQWSPFVEKQYQALPANTPRPQVTIAGTVQPQSTLPPNAQLLLRHQSLPVAQLLKQMNIYSNNDMAEMFAQSVGGATVVAQTASRLAHISASEIQLKNGSGLAIENRLSPRAVTQLFMTLEDKLKAVNLSLSDLFPVMGRDRQGTLQWRNMPQGLTVKTGTLNQVSALTGMIPTQERGIVWFTIINSGSNFDRLRAEQDKLLQRLAQHWQILPTNLNPGPTDKINLGDPARNLAENSTPKGV